MLESSLDAAYRYNLQTARYDSWTPVIERVTGFSAEDFSRFTMDDFLARIPAEERAWLQQEMARSTGDGHGKGIAEFRFCTKDGTMRWLANHYTFRKDTHHRLHALIGTLSDITERKQVEEALRSSEKRFHELAELAPVGIFLGDAHGETTYVNQRWSDITGWPLEHGLGHQWKDGIHPEDRDNVARAQEQFIRERREVCLEYRYLTPDGTKRWIMVNMRPLLDNQGKFSGFLGTVSDITARKKIEEELRQADRTKDEFLAVLSHELQTPLTSMLGWSAEALRLGTPELMAQAMEVVHRNAVRQKRLVDDLLAISRLIHRKMEFKRERIDLATHACQAVENVRHLAAERQLTLCCQSPTMPLPVLADPARMQQCIGNLLNNSLKFTPAGGSITVCCRRDGQQAVISVTDTGSGIPADALPSLFQVFHQVERVEPLGGLGLGLAITRGIVELHGGSIRAESEGVGRGSCFTILLPLADTSREGKDERGIEPGA